MKRTFAAVVAAAAAALGLGAGGAASAAETPQQASAIPTGVYISEVGTQGNGSNATFNKDFIELSNLGTRNVAIGGHRIVASFGSQTFEVARVPDWTVLSPGESYLLTSQHFVGSVSPDQVFTTTRDLPNLVGIGLLSRQGELVDSFATTRDTQFRSGQPAQALSPADGAARLSLHRVQITGNDRVDYRKMRMSPGVSEELTVPR